MSDGLSYTNRVAPLAMRSDEFRATGYQLVDRIADFLDSMAAQPVNPVESPVAVREALGAHRQLPQEGEQAHVLLQRAADLLFDHSLFNGHPKFFGYITSSAAPIGALADLLAAAVNPNVGAQILSPVATAIEKQVIKWLGEFIGVPACFDGILVSGGNMANFTAFFAAISAKIPERKKDGNSGDVIRPVIYCCRTTHTWI